MSEDVAFYDYYYELMAAIAEGGPRPAWHDGRPQGGCYRLWRPSGVHLPVRIHRDGPTSPISVLVDGQPAKDPNLVWKNCATDAVSFDVYEARRKSGAWPGERGIGDNTPDVPVQEKLPTEIAKAVVWLEHLGDIKTKAQADEAANVADDISKLCVELEKVHKAEKDPHWLLCKEIDDRYLPTVKKGREVYARLKRAIGKFAAANAPKPSVPLAPQTPMQPAPAMSFGTTGRKVTAKVKAVARIVDQDKLYQFCRDEPELKDVLQKLAQRALDANVNAPGVERAEEVRA